MEASIGGVLYGAKELDLMAVPLRLELEERARSQLQASLVGREAKTALLRFLMFQAFGDRIDSAFGCDRLRGFYNAYYWLTRYMNLVPNVAELEQVRFQLLEQTEGTDFAVDWQVLTRIEQAALEGGWS